MKPEFKMTGQDRKVLAALMEKIKTINSLTEYRKFIYFVDRAIEEAQKRNAPNYYERFKTMKMGARLSYEAIRPRLERMQVHANVAAFIDWRPM